MSVKTNGAEYKAYINEQSAKWWPDGAYMDDVVLMVNGEEIGEDNVDFDHAGMDDADSVSIICGEFYSTPGDREPTSLIAHFKRWRKAQTTVRIAVEVHKDKSQAVEDAIKAAGGRIVK